jgi:predicted RND superfamily exporter protein
MLSGILISQTISGLLMLFATIYLLYIYFVKNIKAEPYTILTVILLLAIAYGIHGIAHYQIETQKDIDL